MQSRAARRLSSTHGCVGGEGVPVGEAPARVEVLSRAPHPGRTLAVEAGVPDVLGTIGFADRDHALVVSFVVDERQRLGRDARVTLDRLRAHLAASYRLRLHAASPDAADDAVLAPDGAVLDAVGDAKRARPRERLRAAAIAIARAKREAATDPAECLAFWRAMVDGRWTLVDRIDTDGKRLVLAKRNTPSSPLAGALTERERTVLERASLGGSLRGVAYELGLAESTVSEALARGLRRLGLKR